MARKGSLARKTRSAKNRNALREVIRKACARELIKMQEEVSGHLHDGWSGDALASWIAPGIIRSVERAKAKGDNHGQP
jgi:hypothetical protein